MPFRTVLASPFKECPIVNHSIAESSEFDVTAVYPDQAPDFIISGKFSLQQYCTCLLYKLFQLPKSRIKHFIQYQCDLLDDPFTWLNKFEKLIDLNRQLFKTKDQETRFEKTLILVELQRKEIQDNKFTPAARFNFNKIKRKLNTYQTIEEKQLFLAEAKTDYLQNRPLLVPPGEVPFDEKIQLEIDLLKTQARLAKKKQQALAILKKEGSPGSLKQHVLNKVEGHVLSKVEGSHVPKHKFKINTNLNQFIDIFFQLMHEKKINGKPYLEAAPNELAEMIATWFKDKEEKEISVETVKTILKPSRFEKRPKGNSRMDVG